MSEKEFHVFGPPGTGKTFYLVRQIKRAADVHGEQGIMVASFTRAAAVEIAERAEIAKSERVGTLHSLCFRHHGNPTIAELKIKDFNAWCDDNKQAGMKLSARSGAGVDDLGSDAMTGKTEADKDMADLQRARALCIPEVMRKPNTRRFSRHWENFKADAGYMDFTDLIEKAVDDGMMPAPTVEVGFFDEAQDFSKLEFKLIRQWTRYLRMAILVGDDDQTIYKFKGSSPESLIDSGLPDSNVKVLSQSYRVPRAVHAVASSWIKQVVKRQPKEYAPRDADGSVVTEDLFATKDPGAMVDDVEDTLANTDKTIMILASCGYMLDPILSEMKARGVPFANRYRTKRGDWNPLRRGGDRAVTALDRVLALVAVDDDNLITWGRMKLITEHMRADVYRGKKKDFQTIAKSKNSDEPMPMSEVSRYFADVVVDAVALSDPMTMANLCIETKAKPMRYPAMVFERYGLDALEYMPRITVGTIHSTKGAEADRVYLLPDLSRASNEQFHFGDRDSIIRTFYVGMTRAKQDLILCGPSSRSALQWMI